MANYKCTKGFNSSNNMGFYLGQVISATTYYSLGNDEKLNFVEIQEESSSVFSSSSSGFDTTPTIPETSWNFPDKSSSVLFSNSPEESGSKHDFGGGDYGGGDSGISDFGEGNFGGGGAGGDY